MNRHAALRQVLALFFAERRRGLLGGAGLAALTVAAGIGLLGLSGWFVTATALAGASATAAWAFDIFAPGAGVRLLALGRTASRYGERLVTHDATLAVLAGLRERLFRGWAAPQAARQLLARPARLLFRLTADIDALDSLYLRVLVPAVAGLASATVTGLAVGHWVHPALGGALAALLLGVGLGLPWYIARRADRPARRRAHAIEALRARTVDLVAGHSTLLMAGRLPAQQAAVRAADARQAEADDQLNRLDGHAGLGLGITGSLLLAGTLVAAAAAVEAGRIGLPLAALAVLMVLGAIEPFAALRRGALELGRSAMAARRLAPRLAQADAAEPPPVPALPPGHLLQAEALVLRHPGAARPAVQMDRLVLQAGERVAVIGPSGSGKSTLLAAIAGELAPAAGRLQVAAPLALLTQRTELFQDSLRDNLRLAAPRATEAELRQALHAAGLLAHVDTLPAGLDTPLGEGGLGLSGGQQRRLALARLLLRPARLWLLDEPTEGVDAATAADILQRLSDAPGRPAWLMATHLRREAAHADRLLVMHAGRITADLHRGQPAFRAALDTLRPD
ncbi:amino acid ABC transporter ATP-binding/permease protein [Aquincola sp. J276]|uniref:amino acid ABC transporter ATP-binding/permease protein n=1 Tax=Aquincola sp. J276 TaxID=2898432 RepID=UPI0021511786|nr:ATP-binding cassette domain-containing protein [Aquincola sp. J276]MCR5865263.1 ATP-binding cassette domain-containing protein [Aquincola sp. J276]